MIRAWEVAGFEPHSLSLSLSLLSLTFGQSPSARAGHTYAGGDCWRGGQTWCRLQWVYGQTLPVTLWDHFSDAHPEWFPDMEAARLNWNAAPGPQGVEWNQTDPAWAYIGISDAGNGEWLLTSIREAITWNCTNSPYYCSPLNESFIVEWSDVYVNRDVPVSPTRRRSMAAHEMGHALGLWHHLTGEGIPSDAFRLMFSVNWDGRPLAPTDPGDIGTWPPCEDTSISEGGIRCIYNWWWT